MKDNCITNRSRIIDEPIVESILSRRYAQSGIKFYKEFDSDYSGIVCYSNGIKKTLFVRRNSSKYYNSPNFSLSFNKNNLSSYYNSMFAFIDEVADCVYIVDGISLLTYIVEHSEYVKQSDTNSNNYYVIIPKKSIISLIKSDAQCIKYSKQIADILESNRDESKFSFNF